MIDYNSLIYFRYKAVGEGQLNVYDKTPLVFPLTIHPNYFIGLNIHWIPKKDRAELFNNLRDIIQKTNTKGKGKERTRLTYALLKKQKFKVAMHFGIRWYYNSGVSQLKSIPETSWAIIVSSYGTLRSYRMRKVYKKNDYED